MNCYILAIFATLLLSHAAAQKAVSYRVEYNVDAGCNGVNPSPLTLNAPYFSTALDIMQLAVDQGREYRFAATYFSIGFFIDAINGTRSEDPCYWFFYIQSPDGAEIKPDVGVSLFIPGADFTVILRYEQFVSSPKITATYSIEYPTAMCSTATAPATVAVTIPTGSNVLTLMQEAVEIHGSAYRFSSTYFGSGLGYFIDTLNGVSSNIGASCYWIYYVTVPNGTESAAPLGVSSYVIPADGYTITWRYLETEDDGTVIFATAPPSTGAGENLKSSMLVLVASMGLKFFF